MDSQKKFKSGRFQRISKLGKSLAIASGHLALDMAKDRADRILKKSEDLKDLSRRIKAAREVIRSMGELKGALMKLGQMISISEDLILPPEISALFRELQKNSPPMEDHDLNQVFLESFQCLPEEMFKSFDRVPMASASIGQVHKGITKEGDEVAIKIQYPKIKEAIENDFKNLDKIEKLLRTLFPNLPNIESYAQELKRSLAEECDYKKEAENLSYFRNKLSLFENIIIPKVFPKLSSEKVLTMEYLEGDSFEDTLEYSQERKDKLGQLLYDSYMYSFYVLNGLHTDPQNGNYLFTEDKIILLDFGSIRHFSQDFMLSFVNLLIAVEEDDFDQYSEKIIELGFLKQEDDKELFQKHFKLIQEIYSPYDREGRFSIPKSNPINQIKAFIDGVDLRKRDTPREEFLLFDRSNLGIYTKIKAWGSRVDWQTSKLKYRKEFFKKVEKA